MKLVSMWLVLWLVYLSASVLVFLSALVLLAALACAQEVPQDNKVMPRSAPKLEAQTEEVLIETYAMHTIFFMYCQGVVKFNDEKIEKMEEEFDLLLKDVKDIDAKQDAAIEKVKEEIVEFVVRNDLTREKYCQLMKKTYIIHQIMIFEEAN